MATTDYAAIDAELRTTLSNKSYLLGNLANAAAIINKHMEDICWVGFYLLHKDELFVGPFQGESVRRTVPLYHGLPGKVMKTYQTQLNNDTTKCTCGNADGIKKSQLAIPIFYNREPVGVLNIESSSVDRFSEEDCEEMKKIALLIQRVWRHMF